MFSFAYAVLARPSLKRLTYFLSVVLCIAAACGSDADAPAEAASEHGRWGVVQAFRNGQETHMIDVAYFEFDTAARALTTNFTGEETTFDYERDEGGIVTPGNRYFERMDFEALTDSTLQLTTEVLGYYFRISLAPQAERIDRTLVGPGEG